MWWSHGAGQSGVVGSLIEVKGWGDFCLALFCYEKQNRLPLKYWDDVQFGLPHSLLRVHQSTDNFVTWSELSLYLFFEDHHIVHGSACLWPPGWQAGGTETFLAAERQVGQGVDREPWSWFCPSFLPRHDLIQPWGSLSLLTSQEKARVVKSNKITDVEMLVNNRCFLMVIIQLDLWQDQCRGRWPMPSHPARARKGPLSLLECCPVAIVKFFIIIFEYKPQHFHLALGPPVT